MEEIMIGPLSAFADQDHRVVAIGEIEVGIFRRGTTLYAYENRCPHYGGPVCQGKIFRRVEEMLEPDQTSAGLRFADDENVVCPWHGYEFNLVTGRHSGDSTLRLRSIDIRIDNGNVLVRLPR